MVGLLPHYEFFCRSLSVESNAIHRTLPRVLVRVGGRQCSVMRKASLHPFSRYRFSIIHRHCLYPRRFTDCIDGNCAQIKPQVFFFKTIPTWGIGLDLAMPRCVLAGCHVEGWYSSWQPVPKSRDNEATVCCPLTKGSVLS